MSNRTLARRLTNLERRFGPRAEPMFISVVFVGLDGERKEGFTIQVGGDSRAEATTSKNQRPPGPEAGGNHLEEPETSWTGSWACQS
jgi:hypothetical protein